MVSGLEFSNSYIHVCMGIWRLGDGERASDPPKLELQVVVCHSVGARTQISPLKRNWWP